MKFFINLCLAQNLSMQESHDKSLIISFQIIQLVSVIVVLNLCISHTFFYFTFQVYFCYKYPFPITFIFYFTYQFTFYFQYVLYIFNTAGIESVPSMLAKLSTLTKNKCTAAVQSILLFPCDSLSFINPKFMLSHNLRLIFFTEYLFTLLAVQLWTTHTFSIKAQVLDIP